MLLIIISSPTDIPNETAIINSLFSAGLSRFHLRRPGSSARQIAALLDDIHPAFYNRIALHQHHELAQKYDITHLHYTEQARKEATAGILNGQKEKGYTLSTSVHDVRLLPSLAAFQYIFFGPVFNSLSKPDYKSTITSDFKLNKEWAGPLTIALGGIELQNIQTVKAMGFDGAALLGTIWNEPEIAIQKFEQLQASIQE